MKQRPVLGELCLCHLDCGVYYNIVIVQSWGWCECNLCDLPPVSVWWEEVERESDEEEFLLYLFTVKREVELSFSLGSWGSWEAWSVSAFPGSGSFSGMTLSFRTLTGASLRTSPIKQEIIYSEYPHNWVLIPPMRTHTHNSVGGT